LVTGEEKQYELSQPSNIKIAEDLNEFQKMLTRITEEAALNAELDEHLGFEKREK